MNHGPSISEGIVSCRDCGWIIWYHCSHPDSPSGEIAYDEMEGPMLANALPRGSPTPCPPWCPYQEKIAQMENRIAIDIFATLAYRFE